MQNFGVGPPGHMNKGDSLAAGAAAAPGVHKLKPDAAFTPPLFYNSYLAQMT
jgi:hypothetical protein